MPSVVIKFMKFNLNMTLKDAINYQFRKNANYTGITIFMYFLVKLHNLKNSFVFSYTITYKLFFLFFKFYMTFYSSIRLEMK